MSIEGRVVLVTGGARGIGAATGTGLAARGARVVLADVDSEALRQVAEGIGSERVEAVTADVSRLEDMERAADAAVTRFGRIDAVVANAGIASYGSVSVVDPEVVRRLLEINVLGVFHTARATLPALFESRGYFLAVSSLAAFVAAPGLAPYCASKAGVEHFANALRIEVAHRGVDVGSAHMSWMDTPMVQDAKQDLGSFAKMLRRLPYPLGTTTSVDACVKAFVGGIERRKRHVYCPPWVRLAGLNRNVLNSAAGNAPALKMAPELVAEMDAEVAGLGRSTSSRNLG